jgi:hypothetical protein
MSLVPLWYPKPGQSDILYHNSLDIRTIIGRINGLAICFDRDRRSQ